MLPGLQFTCTEVVEFYSLSYIARKKMGKLTRHELQRHFSVDIPMIQGVENSVVFCNANCAEEE